MKKSLFILAISSLYLAACNESVSDNHEQSHDHGDHDHPHDEEADHDHNDQQHEQEEFVVGSDSLTTHGHSDHNGHSH